MRRDLSVDTLPLAGFDPSHRADRSSGAIRGEKDQGWGEESHYIEALTPPPTLPRQGGGAAQWALSQPAKRQQKD